MLGNNQALEGTVSPYKGRLMTINKMLILFPFFFFLVLFCFCFLFS